MKKLTTIVLSGALVFSALGVGGEALASSSSKDVTSKVNITIPEKSPYFRVSMAYQKSVELTKSNDNQPQRVVMSNPSKENKKLLEAKLALVKGGTQLVKEGKDLQVKGTRLLQLIKSSKYVDTVIVRQVEEYEKSVYAYEKKTKEYSIAVDAYMRVLSGVIVLPVPSPSKPQDLPSINQK